MLKTYVQQMKNQTDCWYRSTKWNRPTWDNKGGAEALGQTRGKLLSSNGILTGEHDDDETLLLNAITVTIHFFQVAGSATFQLRLEAYSNPSGKDNSGHCCENPTTFLCGTDTKTCDTYFNVRIYRLVTYQNRIHRICWSLEIMVQLLVQPGSLMVSGITQW